MTGADPLIVFTPSGRRGRFPSGTTVLDAARALGVDLDSVCGGHGLCGRCQVQPAVGTFPKHAISARPESLSAAGPLELDYRERRGLAPDRRLGCVATLRGDTLIDVPVESQVHRQVVRKELALRPFDLDPVVRLFYVEVEPPALASPASDLARLLEALESAWGLRDLEADLDAVRALGPALAAGASASGGGGVTVAIHDGGRISAVWPGLHERALGVACDVGSTTIAGYLADLTSGEVLASDGIMNPQIRFGEDLMSRVSYAMLHAEGAREMTRAVRGALARLVAGLAKSAGIERREILEVTLVGNPVMHHLVLGLDPLPLGTAPFTLATDRAVRIPASAIGLPVHPGARLYVLPCIAGHVGADTAGVILAEAPHRSERVTLLMDVGTNAEIVLGSRDGLLAASSPTGPAFEGAQVSSGQRAAPGAIERVRVDRETLEPRFKVVGCDLWSDEPGFAEAATASGAGGGAAHDGTSQAGRPSVTGICGSGIVEVVAELYLAGAITAAGVIDGGGASRSARIVPDGRTFTYVLHDGPPRLTVTQADVRAIQLAKAAAYAGARLLMDQAGVAEVEEIRLAGAFGSRIDPLHAMVLGLIPDCDLAHVRAVGNAAGSGALMCLLSGAARREIEEVVRTVRKVETAVEPRFQEHFVAALGLPNASAPSPHLERAVTLPPRAPGGAADGPTGRARRGRDRREVTVR